MSPVGHICKPGGGYTLGAADRSIFGAESSTGSAYVVLATTGMRRGEALGSRWSDVDLSAGWASIRQTVMTLNHQAVIGSPKTAKGRRTIVIDGVTVAALREHRRRRAAERLGNDGAGSRSPPESCSRAVGLRQHRHPAGRFSHVTAGLHSDAAEKVAGLVSGGAC